MNILKFNNFLNEAVNDNGALIDILDEYGLANPIQFIKCIEDAGYTIIELDQVGIKESYNYGDDEDYFMDSDFNEIIEENLLNQGISEPDVFLDGLNILHGFNLVSKNDIKK